MLSKYLKIFNLSENFTIDDLNRNHRKLLKEYEIKDVDEELKNILAEEEKKINKYYEFLLAEYNKRDKTFKSKNENFKPSPISSIPIIKQKRKKNFKGNKGKIINSLIIILIIGLFGYFFSSDSSNEITNNILDTSNCEILLENREFIDIESNQLIKDPNDLIYCFRKGGITIKSTDGKKLNKQITFKLEGDSIIYIVRSKKGLIIADIKNLNMLIAESKKSSTNLSSKLEDAVSRIINYNKLKSNTGINGIGTKWRIDSGMRLYLKNKTISNNFNRITQEINKYYKLNEFLKNNLPKSAYNSILSINNKISDLKKIKEKLTIVDSTKVIEENLISECKNIDNEYDYTKNYYSLINISSDTAQFEFDFYKNKSNEIIKEFKNQKEKLSSCICVDCIIKLESNDHIKMDSLIYSYQWNNYLSKYPTDSTYVNSKPKEIDLNRNSNSSNNSENKGICRTIRGSYFWKIKLNNLKNAKNVSNKSLKSEGLINETKEKVERFRSCRCKKCNHELNNPSLKAIINQFFKENKQSKKINEEYFVVVEDMPEFPGGDVGLMKFIQRNVRYPAIAKEYNITGKVYVSFIVDKQGNVTNVKIVKGVSKELDDEALRVVSLLPKYKPGKQRGKTVRVMFTIPINFTLN